MTQTKTDQPAAAKQAADPEPEPQPVPEPEPEAKPKGRQTSAKAVEAETEADIGRKLAQQLQDHREQLEAILHMKLEGHTCHHCDGMGYTQEPEPELVQDPTKKACPGCHGYGLVLTPSRAAGHETAMCISCSGQGWVTQTAEPPPPPQIAQAAPAAISGMVGQVLPGGMFLPFGASEPVPLASLSS